MMCSERIKLTYFRSRSWEEWLNNYSCNTWLIKFPAKTDLKQTAPLTSVFTPPPRTSKSIVKSESNWKTQMDQKGEEVWLWGIAFTMILGINQRLQFAFFKRTLTSNFEMNRQKFITHARCARFLFHFRLKMRRVGVPASPWCIA